METYNVAEAIGGGIYYIVYRGPKGNAFKKPVICTRDTLEAAQSAADLLNDLAEKHGPNWLE